MRKLYFDPLTDITGARNRSNETDYDVVYTHDRVELRHFPQIQKNKKKKTVGRKTPVLLIPPLAGNPSLFDIHPQYSAVQILQQAGFDQYLLSWGNPTDEDRHNSIDTYMDEVANAVQLIKRRTGVKKVSLVGYCLGGILGAFYASRNDDLQCLAVLNSPFNFASEGIADDMMKALYDVPKLVTFGLISRKDFPVRNASGRLSGAMYQLSNPAAAIKGYIALYRNCLNKEETEIRLSMQDALSMMNYPGQAMQDMIECALGNEIVEGTMMVHGKPIDLSQIKVPVFCGSGLSDNTVPQSAVLTSLDIIRPKNLTAHRAQGGHIGAVFGTGSVHDTWNAVANWAGALEKSG
jgi:polyhydroxyalkanoate synthase